MNKSSLVSVIVPVYNTEKYLQKCLDSIMKQEYYNLEIIIIDDGSTDKSGIIADEFADKDNRIVVFHKKNGGVSFARNIGIKHATGKYITFVDADDMIHKKFILNIINSMLITGADITTTEKAMNSISGEEFLLNIVNQDIVYKEYTPKEALLALYGGKLEKGGNGCQIFKLSFLRKNKLLYDTSMSISEDFDFFARAILVSNKIIVDHRDMYFYRRNVDSVTHEDFNIKHYNAIYNVQKVGRSVEKQIPEIRNVLDSNLLLNSISYGTLMYGVRKKYLKEFDQIKTNIKKYRYSTLFSPDVKLTGRIKALIVAVFGINLGLRIINKLIRL